ncbi:MAG TPA: outer membrane beta-barrel protein [Terriglobales bacterium]|nr:outer membrane beta-barrel protein [Terriglobales bacterium]
MLSRGLKVVILGVMFASPLVLLAQASSAADPSAPNNGPQNKAWWREITTDGFMSLSYTYNTNDPADHLNQFRVFDFNTDPQLDVAQIVVQHAVGEVSRYGFRYNMIAGSGVPEITAAYGMFRDKSSGIAHHFDIPEAYVSYVAPAGKGLRFDLGKFVTHLGYEVIGGYDGYNDNFSRGFIFGYGVPFTHTGIKASYSFNSRVSSALLITNGCDAVTRLNGGVTVGGQLAAVTSKNTTLTFNFLHGPERPHNDHDQRSVYEITGSWKVLPRFAVAFDSLYADEDHASADGSDAIWKGFTGYAKYNLTKEFSVAFRGEIFGDDGGSRTGTTQTLRGFTLTPEYVLPAKLSQISSALHHFDGKWVTRGEFRQDLSDHPTFQKGTSYTTRQFTTAVNLIYLF